jgi:HEAT repeat protein
MFIIGLSFFISSCLELKQSLIRQLGVESFQEAASCADTLSEFDDIEACYLAIQAYAGSFQSDKAIGLIDAHKGGLINSGYYYKALEVVALSLLKVHFNAFQEPIKLAALTCLSMDSDARILDLILEAFQSPSIRVKALALRNLSNFPDEKVKTLLLESFKLGAHCGLNQTIAQLFGLWQDQRIIPLLVEKLHEDTLSLDEKINYILVIKDLVQDIPLEKVQSFAQSCSASERLLATYLISSTQTPLDMCTLSKLLQDHHLWVKQSALMSVIKTKGVSKEIQEVIERWKDEKSFELVKGYYYFGLVNHDEKVIQEFIELFKKAPLSLQKSLASIIYAAGGGHESVIKELLELTSSPHIRLQWGLYLLSGDEYKEGVAIVLEALERVKDQKIYVITDPVLPFFTIDDESNSAYCLSAGQRRSMDQHMRLKIFHLLAMKKMPEAKQVLKNCLKTDLFDVSLEAMIHFWENFGYEDSQYLKSILQDPDPQLRLKAALVLSYLDFDKQVRGYLMDCFAKQSYQIQIQILFALSKYHEEDVIQFYVKNLKSNYPLLQAVTAGCLFSVLYK